MGRTKKITVGELIDKLFDAMRHEIDVMEEYGGNEESLMEALDVGGAEVLTYYAAVYLGFEVTKLNDRTGECELVRRY